MIPICDDQGAWWSIRDAPSGGPDPDCDVRHPAAIAATDIGGNDRSLCPVPEAVRARIRGVIVDTSRRLQSVYVPVGDGVRLAVDVWLPVERTAVGGTVGTVMRVTRYLELITGWVASTLAARLGCLDGGGGECGHS